MGTPVPTGTDELVHTLTGPMGAFAFYNFEATAGNVLVAPAKLSGFSPPMSAILVASADRTYSKPSTTVHEQGRRCLRRMPCHELAGHQATVISGISIRRLKFATRDPAPMNSADIAAIRKLSAQWLVQS